MRVAKYYPTYMMAETLDVETADWLKEQQNDGPLEMIDITDVCATFGVRAEVRDEQGFLIMRVDEKGNYYKV